MGKRTLLNCGYVGRKQNCPESAKETRWRAASDFNSYPTKLGLNSLHEVKMFGHN